MHVLHDRGRGRSLIETIFRRKYDVIIKDMSKCLVDADMTATVPGSSNCLGLMEQYIAG